MANLKQVIVATALAFANAGSLDTSRERIVSMPMHKFSGDCGTKSSLRLNQNALALLQTHNVPGAGIAKFKPFDTVLKDGFMAVDCMKDYMYYRGDKFGDNKHDYKLGPVSNVSIVHYDAFVANEDQTPMTHKKCFEFCRTVPNMGFFGIVNGRGCYCTPYFNAMESDSSECDSVCEGDSTLMCGGKSKSSLFAMHMCESTKEDLQQRASVAASLKAEMDSKEKSVAALSKDMQATAEYLQKSLGAVGDSAASGLAQDAKVFAGTLEHAAEDTKEAAAKMGSLIKDVHATQVKGDFTKPAVVTKAEKTMEDIDAAVATGEIVTDKLDELNILAKADGTSTVAGAAKQYYPVMYFVDKEFEGVPTTCGGDKVAKPIVARSMDGCATICDKNVHDCVGFQYFNKGDVTLCFLFSKFTTGFYYTGCGKAGPAELGFLQETNKAAPYEAKCFAKLSKFEGTTLKPNPSGKCAQCFKTLTKADRCYK
jgi:hypothetical protein